MKTLRWLGDVNDIVQSLRRPRALSRSFLWSRFPLAKADEEEEEEEEDSDAAAVAKFFIWSSFDDGEEREESEGGSSFLNGLEASMVRVFNCSKRDK